MKVAILTSFCASVILGQVCAQSTVTEPIGFNKVTCLNNSDTVVGVPFRVQGSQRVMLSAAPAVNGDSATLTFSNTNFTAGEFSKHYLKFTDGYRAGRWYPIETTAPNVVGGPAGTPNTATQVTIFLNGDVLSDGGGSVGNGDKVIIAQYWTLDTLFPPVASPGVTGPTTAWTLNTETGVQVPNGHAIVASTSDSITGRRTELLLPNLVGVGTNIAPNVTYYLFSGGWRKQGATLPSETYGEAQLTPDSYFIVRHRRSVSYSTVYRCLGDVEMGSFTIPLTARASGRQDNAIGLPRPVNLALNDLGLVAPAFVASTGDSITVRKDQLLVFNNAVNGFNKAPDRTYYYNGGWRKQGESGDFGTDTIPAGGGFLIRKASDGTGSTVFWTTPAVPIVTP